MCGCFKATLNPDLPYKVLVGDAPNVIRDARVFARQSEAVPVFIKQGVNKWEYVGNFVVEHYTEDEQEFRPFATAAGRPHAVGLLLLKKVGPG